MNFDKLTFHDSYENHTFIIYPFIKYNKNQLFGSITIPDNKWDGILKRLSKSTNISSNSKIYIYRDLEYHLINSNINVLHNKIIHTEIQDDMLIKIEKHERLNNDCFPKLNKYHDEYEKKVLTYNFGNVLLNLVIIAKELKIFKHIEIKFQYKKDILKAIIKDLSDIRKILN